MIQPDPTVPAPGVPPAPASAKPAPDLAAIVPESLEPMPGSAALGGAEAHTAQLPPGDAAAPVAPGPGLGGSLMLGGATALTALSIDIVLPALPLLQIQFEVSEASVQLVLGVFMIAFGVGQLVQGPLMDRFGRRPVLLWGVGVYTAGAALALFAESLSLLLLARALQGLGGSAGVVAARAIVRDRWEGPAAVRAMASLTQVMALAPLLAPILGGFLTDHVGWRASFTFLTGYGLVLWVAVALAQPETLRQPDPLALHPQRLLSRWWLFLRTPAAIGSTAINATMFGGLFCFIASSSFVFKDVAGIGPDMFGLLFAATAAALSVGAWLSRYYAGRIAGQVLVRRALLVQNGFALLLLVLALAGLRGDWALAAIMVPMAVYIGCVGLIAPQTMAAAMQPMGAMAGIASSLIGAVQMLFAAGIAALAATLYDGTARPMAGFLWGLNLLAVGLFVFYVRRRPGLLGSGPVVPHPVA